MGSHWNLRTGRDMYKAVIKIKSDDSVQGELLWQSFLSSSASCAEMRAPNSGGEGNGS